MIGMFRFKFRTLGEVDKLEQKLSPYNLYAFGLVRTHAWAIKVRSFPAQVCVRHAPLTHA